MYEPEPVPQEVQRLEAAEKEAKRGSDEGLFSLFDLLLNGEYKYIRVMAASALREADDYRAVVPLITALRNDKQFAVRRFAAAALANMADPRSTEALVQALSDPEDGDTRLSAIRGLQNIGEPAIPYLLPLLETEGDVPRILAAAALGSHGNDKAFGILTGALQKQLWFTRIALHSLAQIGNPTAIEAIISVLDNDERADARSTAAWWLGKSGNPCAVASLEARLTDTDLSVRQSVRAALAEIKQ